jgi:uncharacterized damage-inducible protein DinB
MDRTVIDQYEQGGEKISLAIRGLSREDLLLVPPADAPAEIGRWSIQQVVIHLTDADLIWAARMKCIIAEQNPTIVGYDERRFANSLFYDQQDAAVAVQLFDLNRRQFSRVLRHLPDTALDRTGTHNERGQITLAQSLQWMVEHVDHHVGFIHRKRAWMGKEMW